MLKQRQEEPATIQMMGMDAAGAGQIRVISRPPEGGEARRVGEVRLERDEPNRGLALVGFLKDPTHHTLIFFRREGAGHVQDPAARGQHPKRLAKKGLLKGG